MPKDLSKIHQKLLESINVGFKKAIEIDAIIETINIDHQFFTIKTEDNSKIIECHTQEDLSQAKPGERIRLKGWMRLHPNNTGKVYLLLEYFYAISEKEKYTTAIDFYSRLNKALSANKYQNIIKKITTIEPPKKINNVALIVMPNNDLNIENFKVTFQNSCYGQLYVYHLKNDNDGNFYLTNALEFFKKYHDIDLICLLTNQLTIGNICELSSKNNVRYMLNRKDGPYIISIVTTNTDKNTAEPLTAMLSNKKISGINATICFIHDIQSTFRKQLDDGIKLGTNILERIIESKDKKLFELQVCMSEFYDPKNINNNKYLPIDKLKDLLDKHLTKEKMHLQNIQQMIMKNIITHSVLQKYYPMFIEAEQKALKKNSEIKKNPFEDQSEKIIRNDNFSTMALDQSDKSFPATTEDTNNLIKIKHIALQQNPYFQEHPEKIMDAADSFDVLLSEMPLSKKIENKITNNNPAEMLNINIQRRHNGDF